MRIPATSNIYSAVRYAWIQPREAPLNRPSVTRATDDPSPAPTSAAPGLSISGIPGLKNKQTQNTHVPCSLYWVA